MARKTSSHTSGSATTSKQTPDKKTEPSSPIIVFPKISKKFRKNLKVETLLEDQVVLVHDVFNQQEVKDFIRFFETLQMTHSPPAKRGEAQRTNDRFSTISPEFAAHLYESTGLIDIVHDWPARPSNLKNSGSSMKARGLLENIRVYSYTEGQYFASHYDESQRSQLNPMLHTEWTLLIYLSAPTTPLIGGETIFHLPGNRNSNGKKTLSVNPVSGSAMLHRHGKDCLLHEGSVVKSGVKWVLRSDILFG
ncbi:Prolyl 4-hydroxylase, alpha subunit [Phaffia rhodozyma]|uniref:Prolyl 4-hydroxylase, alpha subunit n=1 Tax=Phaffia rhodozyma TaxID=264483 RepID=A0A0F7SE66_PHARH|nr:Prolyl 4-hydroxylase, alpha subunit [Phaffia rhodozyma]